MEARPKGIRFDIGRREIFYWGETLAPHVNRRVQAFFNLECPELLVCSDLNRQRAAFMQPAKLSYGSLPTPMAATITRGTEHDAATRELGAFVNEAQSRKPMRPSGGAFSLAAEADIRNLAEFTNLKCPQHHHKPEVRANPAGSG